jgi:predicted ATP-grasp superfamily ATP-dependent carboligase
MRESIPVLPDIYDPAVRLATAIGLEGACEVEFRRDKAGRPLLMEINPRLAGTIENALRSGVDLPMLIWRWATGLDVGRVDGYRIGVRTHWLHGEVRWLRDNWRRAGRPDSVPRGRAALNFAAELVRTRNYDCFDRHDIGPALVELRYTATSIRKSRTAQRTTQRLPGKRSLIVNHRGAHHRGRTVRPVDLCPSARTPP